MVAQIANGEAGSLTRSKLNTILAGDAARRVWGVKLSEASPFEAIWLTESELRDIIGVFGTDARGLVPSPGTPTGSRVLYDTGWAEASASIVDGVDDDLPHPTTSPYLVTSVFNEHRFFTNASDHFVHFPPGLSFEPAAHGRLTAPPNNTLSIRASTGVSISGVAGNGSTTIWTVPAAGTVEWVVYANNTIEMYGDTTAELLLTGPLNLATQTIYPGAPVFHAGTRPYFAEDSGKCFNIHTTAGTQSIPAGLPSGWEVTILNNTSGSFIIDGPGALTVTLTSGQVCNVKYWSGTTIKVAVGDTVGIN